MFIQLFSPLRRLRARSFIILLLAISGIGGAAYAMRVSPMVVEMTTSGVNSTARVEVQNLNSGNLPFETRITRIDYDADGNQHETPADGDFLVFPPQGLLPQNARQVIRVQWVGGADLPASRAYYLSVNQIPVKLAPQEDGGSAGAQVQLVYHIKVLMTVSPPNAKPAVAFVSAKPVMIAPKAAPGATEAPAGPATPGLAVTVKNTGNRYAMMAGSTWTIDGTGADGKPLHVVLKEEDLNRLIGAGYLAPLGGQRTFQIPTDAPFGSQPIKVRFS
ncbi:MAG TPA: fimbria/pilus periplasmic chaperone [Sphingomonas sp.]|nr:fimbria/pilus periplasmic chaperone [Sphingomonas sp.]